MSCNRYVRWMDGLLLGERLGGRASELFEHLRGCDRCAARYDRVMSVARALRPPSDEPSGEELATIGDSIAARTPRPRRRATLFQALAGAGMLVAAATAAVVLMVPAPLPSDEEVQPRGRAATFDADLRAYCLRQQGDTVSVVAVSDAVHGDLRCAVTDAVQFAYRLRSPATAFLAIVGTDEDGRLHPYQPRPPGDRAQAVFATDREQVLAGSVRLGVNHRPGKVRIVALFSASPLTLQQVEAALARASDGEPSQPLRLLSLQLEVTR